MFVIQKDILKFDNVVSQFMKYIVSNFNCVLWLKYKYENIGNVYVFICLYLNEVQSIRNMKVSVFILMLC